MKNTLMGRFLSFFFFFNHDKANLLWCQGRRAMEMCQETLGYENIINFRVTVLGSSTVAQGNKECAAEAYFLNSKMELWFTQCSPFGFTLPSDTLLAEVTFHFTFSGFLQEADTLVKVVWLTHFCEKHWSSDAVKFSSKLRILQPPSGGSEMQVNAVLWLSWPLCRPQNEVTVTHYLEYGNERPIASMILNSP